jgi:choline dehydrogenase
MRAEREVILAAGAIGTPKLLQLSGIGDPAVLAPLGSAVLHALPGVGAGLNDHVNIKLSAFVNTPTYNTQRRGLAAARCGIEYLCHSTGPASSPANHCQGFLKTDPSLPSADVQIQLMAFGFGTEAQMRQNGITAVVSLCRPQARGTVRLRSGDATTPPRIAMAMLENATDVATLLRGSRFAYAALQRIRGARIYAPCAPPATDAAWLDFFRETAWLNWHPTSTCRMGPNPARDVVDGTLCVHGMPGLSIADASVMPSVTSANTNAPVIAIAERAAGFIAARTA